MRAVSNPKRPKRVICLLPLIAAQISRLGASERYNERDDLEASDEEQLADEVDKGGVDGQRVHVRVEIALPQESRQASREKEGRDDLE